MLTLFSSSSIPQAGGGGKRVPVPETSASMAQTGGGILHRAQRLGDAVFFCSDQLEEFYIGNKDTEQFLAGHLFIQ